jgi:hypothetical protein
MLIFSEVGFQIRPSGNNECNHNQIKDKKGNNAFNPVLAAAPVDVGTDTWQTHHAQEDDHHDFGAEEDNNDAEENDLCLSRAVMQTTMTSTRRTVTMTTDCVLPNSLSFLVKVKRCNHFRRCL